MANPPFAGTTGLARRLLGDPAVPLAGAELILAWGAARWLAAARPRDEETAWWAARYQIRLIGRVAAASFAPPPATDAAHLSIRPRPLNGLPGGPRALRGLLRSAWRDRSRPVELSLPGGLPNGRSADALRGAVRAAIGARTPAAELTADQWHQVAVLLTGARSAAATSRPPAGPPRPTAAPRTGARSPASPPAARPPRHGQPPRRGCPPRSDGIGTRVRRPPGGHPRRPVPGPHRPGQPRRSTFLDKRSLINIR